MIGLLAPKSLADGDSFKCSDIRKDINTFLKLNFPSKLQKSEAINLLQEAWL